MGIYKAENFIFSPVSSLRSWRSQVSHLLRNPVYLAQMYICNDRAVPKHGALTIHLNILTIHSPSITKNWESYSIFISNRTSVEQWKLLAVTFIQRYDKRDDFGFPVLNFSLLTVDVSRLPSYGIQFAHLFRLPRCCTSVLDSHSKIFKWLQSLWHSVTDITSFEKHSASSSGHTLSVSQKLVKYRFQNMFLKESLTRSFSGI